MGPSGELQRTQGPSTVVGLPVCHPFLGQWMK